MLKIGGWREQERGFGEEMMISLTGVDVRGLGKLWKRLKGVRNE